MKREKRAKPLTVPGDPVTREIIKGALRAAQAEMEAVIERTAMSPFIREKNDYFAGILDARGRVVCGTMLPLFGNLTEIIFAQYPPETMRPGDLYWYNDCHGSRGGEASTAFGRGSGFTATGAGCGSGWWECIRIEGSVAMAAGDARAGCWRKVLTRASRRGCAVRGSPARIGGAAPAGRAGRRAPLPCGVRRSPTFRGRGRWRRRS